MPKRILVAVDGSKTSLLAFKEAMNLAKGLQAKLCIFNILEKLPDRTIYAIDVIKYQKLAREKSQKLLNKLLLTAKKNKISAEAELIEILHFEDTIANKICKKAKKWKADLLVTGTHGYKGFNRFILGSVADELIKTSPVPVLVVKAKK